MFCSPVFCPLLNKSFSEPKHLSQRQWTFSASFVHQEVRHSSYQLTRGSIHWLFFHGIRVLTSLWRRTQRGPARKAAGPSSTGTAVCVACRVPLRVRDHSSSQTRTYRLRKDQYTKSLESEVARLRTAEADLLCQNQDLANTIRTLGDLLADCGIHVELPTLATQKRDVSDVPGGFAGEQSYPQITPAPLDKDARSSWPDFSQANCLTQQQDNTLPFTGFTGNAPTIPTTSRHWRLRLGDLDSTTVGMEFVLAYVRPNLYGTEACNATNTPP